MREFSYEEFIKKDCNYETSVAESVTRCMFDKLYTKAYNEGFTDGVEHGLKCAEQIFHDAIKSEGAANEQ